MSLRTMGMVAVAAMLALPAAAQNGGRYSLERGDNGFVRLDTETGEMSLCREADDGLVCGAAEEDMRELRRERDRLRTENRELREENEVLHAELERRRDLSDEDLPSEEEMEHIANWFERMMAIMMRTVRNVEDEVDCENDPDCRDRDRDGR